MDHTTGDRVESINPATGEPIAACTHDQLRRIRAASPPPRSPPSGLAQLAGAAAGRDRTRSWALELRRHKADLGRLVIAGGGRGPLRGAGRSAGDDRHVRPRWWACRASSTARPMHSERPGHRMYEQWHPLWPVGGDQRLQLPRRRMGRGTPWCAAVCGDSVLWKPSHQGAAHRGRRHPHRRARPGGQRRATHLQPGGRRARPACRRRLVADRRFPLISFTGSRCASGGRSARSSPTASAACCWSSAATTACW